MSGGEKTDDLFFYKQKILNADVNIASDSGIKIYKKLNIIPDYLIGDLDSANERDILWAKDNNVEILKYPSQKDEIDSELSIMKAQQLGCEKVYLSSVTGSRIDHTLAGIYLLGKYSNLDPEIIEEKYNIGIVKDKKNIMTNIDDSWAILPLGEDLEGLTLKGFKYNLFEQKLDKYDSIGVSNQAKEEIISISLKKGIVVYIHYKSQVK
ncbi:MAG: thiamine diphosphokinase [Thermotogota bacterium]